MRDARRMGCLTCLFSSLQRQRGREEMPLGKTVSSSRLAYIVEGGPNECSARTRRGNLDYLGIRDRVVATSCGEGGEGEGDGSI